MCIYFTFFLWGEILPFFCVRFSLKVIWNNAVCCSYNIARGNMGMDTFHTCSVSRTHGSWYMEKAYDMTLQKTERKPSIWKVDGMLYGIDRCVSILYIHSLPCTPSPNYWLVLLSPRPLLLWRLRKSSRCLSGWEIQQLLLVLSVLTHIFMFLSHLYVSSSLPASLSSSAHCHFIYPTYLIFFSYFSLCLSLYIPPLFISVSWFSVPLHYLFSLFCFSLHAEQWMSCFPPPQPPEFCIQVILFIYFSLVRHWSFHLGHCLCIWCKYASSWICSQTGYSILGVNRVKTCIIWKTSRSKSHDCVQTPDKHCKHYTLLMKSLESLIFLKEV